MRRLAALLIIGGGLLLIPGAASSPLVPGDPTPPVVTPVITGTLGSNGWYLTNVTLSWLVSDPESIILDTTGCDTKTLTADTPGTTLTCSATSDGGTTTVDKTIKIDKTPPTATASPSRGADTNGWYNHGLTVTFTGSDAMSGLDFCSAPADYTGPDSANASVGGSCKDKAGNTKPTSLAFKYDATAPGNVVGSPSRGTDKNGWYNHALTVAFQGSDATSGVASCTQTIYDGPDDPSVALSGSCTDKAGNQSGSSFFTLKYDETSPTNSGGTRSRPPDANGWYNHALTVSFAGTDATSGIDRCTEVLYSAPDTENGSVSGSCNDKAGNQSGSSSVGFKYDGTGPALTPAASRPADKNGWYNHTLTVSFPGTDATSGIDACDGPKSYNTPDSSTASVTGECSDEAGNTTTKSHSFKYDGTKPEVTSKTPSRLPDAHGWYNHALTVTYAGSDNLSGIDACTKPGYGGPDDDSASVSGSCTDMAGNQSPSSSFAFKYDGTKPEVVSKTPSRPPNADGWYKEPLTVTYAGGDNLSEVDSCSKPTYSGPESPTASVSGSCTDNAGNESAQSSFGFKYDSTGPAVIPSSSRGPDSNDWYNHRLSVSFAGTDGGSGLASCAPPQSYEGPDSVFAVVSGTCTDKAGNVGLGSLALRYDATAPQVAGASADRAPDGNGWYNHPLTISFHGSDATSQIAACTVAGYAGPDNPSASVAGSCSDRAGNPSGTSAFALKYDASVPSLTNVTVKAGNRIAVLSWTPSADTMLVEIRRAETVVYRGTGRTFTDKGLANGVRYRYTLTGYDEAFNAATAAAAATPSAPLVSPKAGAVVSAPPRLAWRAAPNAKYYNVQVWRRGRIYSSWPTGTSVQLRRTWRYDGRRYRLTPGRYRWYVWPGRGARAKKDFGPLIGSSSFVVR